MIADMGALLERMKQLEVADIVSYNTCLTVLPPLEAERLLERLMESGNVDSWSFNTVISLWAKAGRAARAASVLHKMHAYYQKTGDANFKPDQVGLSTILRALAEDGKAHQAEAVLRRMQQDVTLKIDALTMTVVIYAWSKSRDPSAPSRALKLLEEMENSTDSRLKPDTIAYNAVLATMANSPSQGEAAEALLRRMQQRHEAGEYCEPSVVSYATVMLAWKNTPQGASRAEQLLQELQHKSLSAPAPNQFCYSTVISALAKEGLVARAEELLKEMETSPTVHPNVIAYTSVMEGESLFSLYMCTSWFERL
jgi:pentatricopeptide repeat protein